MVQLLPTTPFHLDYLTSSPCLRLGVLVALLATVTRSRSADSATARGETTYPSRGAGITESTVCRFCVPLWRYTSVRARTRRCPARQLDETKLLLPLPRQGRRDSFSHVARAQRASRRPQFLPRPTRHVLPRRDRRCSRTAANGASASTDPDRRQPPELLHLPANALRDAECRLGQRMPVFSGGARGLHAAVDFGA